MKFIYAFDFDGVLVDSAAELGLSGYYAAKLLFPDASWLTRKLRRPDQLEQLILNFCKVRPCLETGWEAPLLLKLLTEDDASIDKILKEFQHGLRETVLEDLGVSVDQCKDALEKARNEWIASDKDGQDWLEAHGFYQGACDAVRKLLEDPDKLPCVYIITTKAADFTQRLLEQQRLAGKNAPGGGIPPQRIFGLGSPPKEKVLAQLLEEKGSDYAAVFVEDRLLTLDKTMSDSSISARVLPVVASWGYNTAEQQTHGKEAGYIVLKADDPASLGNVLNDPAAEKLLKDLNDSRNS
jgi:phosphoglycolate phosphatase-like HAD superfamily hydrolase